MAKKKYKRPRQISVYAPDPLIKQLEEEGRRRRRKVSPTVLEILREYFDGELVPREPVDAEAR